MGTMETKKINRELVEEVESGGIGRRDFLKGAAIGAVGMGSIATFLGCSSTNEAEAEEEVASADSSQGVVSTEGVSELTGWAGTPSKIAALGGSTMPLEDLNRYRQEYIDSQTDYVCEDGTVIPAVFAKVRALINTYGMGCGNTAQDTSFTGILAKFTEDDAQAYIEMPLGEKFNAIDFHEKTGRPIEECEEICDRISDNGFLCRFNTNQGVTYHHVPYFQGVLEYAFVDIMEDPSYSIGVNGMDWLPNDEMNTGTPVFYAIPCDKSVVADGIVLPYDDVEQILNVKEGAKIAIAPCYCRYTALARSEEVTDFPSWEDFASGEYEDYFSPLEDLRVETCLIIGDEAEYWLNRGVFREITQEKALEYMRRSRDDGFILNNCFSKESGTICSCRTGACGIIKLWSSLGSPEAIGASQPYGQISHYNLDTDMDACIQCGQCAERCPLHAITMDGEGGTPVVNESCFRCGQCAYVCPQEARKLVQRPDDEILELPRGFLDDHNQKAAYRFEHGLIF